MSAKTTNNAEEFIEAAGAHVRSDPVGNSILLTMMEGMRKSGGKGPTAYWTWAVDEAESGGGTVGGCVCVPPNLAILSGMEASAAAACAASLHETGAPVAGVLGPTRAAGAFVEEWTRATGGTAVAGRTEHILRLDTALPSLPGQTPAGRARPAAEDELEPVTDFFLEAAAGSGISREEARRSAQRQIASGHLLVWDDGEVAAVVGRTPASGGVVRITPMHTVPERRGRGYARALFAETLEQGRAEGASTFVLFTEAENTAAQSLFRSFGFRDHGTTVEYRFE